MNGWLKDSPWRLQEMTDTLIGNQEGPSYGRRYKIFYGPRECGEISLQDFDTYSKESPSVYSSVELLSARSYGADYIMTLLGGLVHHVASGSRDEIDSAYLAIRTAMIDAMWQIGPEVVSYSVLEVGIIGSGAIYLRGEKIKKNMVKGMSSVPNNG